MATAKRPTAAPAAKKPAAKKPAAKSTRNSAQEGTSRPAEAKGPSGPALTPTEVPGVFRNAAGLLVNEFGFLLGLGASKKAEQQDMSEVLGHPVRTPAEFLKAISLDPRIPLPTRMEAAKAAAPYTDRKQPQGLDGGVGADGKPLPIRLEMSLPPELLDKLSESELETWGKILGLLKEHDLLINKEGSA